jgi:hypothetical protein
VQYTTGVPSLGFNRVAALRPAAGFGQGRGWGAIRGLIRPQSAEIPAGSLQSEKDSRFS